MGKDSYWFKHDSTASRDLKMMQIKAIHGFAGIGIFWAVIEVLREQNGYVWEKSDTSMQILAKIIDCDLPKFNSFIEDCKRIGLFKCNHQFIYSERLMRDMNVWEGKKKSGSEAKSKRNRSESTSEIEAKHEAKQEDKNKKINKNKDKKVFVAPSEDQVTEYFVENGYSQSVAKQAYKYYSVANWVDSRGNPILNWKQKMINVWFKDEHKSNDKPKIVSPSIYSSNGERTDL